MTGLIIIERKSGSSVMRRVCLRREFRALVDETIERRPRALEVVCGAGDGAARRDARRRHDDGGKRQHDQQKDAGRHAGFHPVVPADLLSESRSTCVTRSTRNEYVALKSIECDLMRGRSPRWRR